MYLQLIKDLLWQRTAGYYLFWTGFVYFWTAMYNVFVEQFTSIILIQAVWFAILALPLVFKPMAKWLNMRTIWER